METETQAALAAALAAGYALGRTKKGKVAIGAASVLAGQGLLSPKELLNRALRKAYGSPQAAQLLEQMRGELMGAARSALSATADRRLAALAASLQQRTDSLVGRPDDEAEESSEGTEPDDEAEESSEGTEPDDEEEEGDEEKEREEATGEGEGKEPQVSPRRSRAKKSPAKRSAPRTAPAKKVAAGRKAAGSAPAKKNGASGKASTRGSRRR
ncbi:hypothetical protein PV415_36390 [Streptomyces sp. ME03-5684b]|uniref:hypothetical protein n=1 Tax=Streptomyces sp. ME03-5684b TaxID=3028681 RepID=UPI0029A10A87|nr:hypothetical protein [Streptomyces sp. ME03-5684b]MDX3322382.1 hypothetical protein [Streptomyces sp. ME03-5684b]